MFLYTFHNIILNLYGILLLSPPSPPCERGIQYCFLWSYWPCFVTSSDILLPPIIWCIDLWCKSIATNRNHIFAFQSFFVNVDKINCWLFIDEMYLFVNIRKMHIYYCHNILYWCIWMYELMRVQAIGLSGSAVDKNRDPNSHPWLLWWTEVNYIPISGRWGRVFSS